METLSHNDRFMLAVAYVREARYAEASELYSNQNALQSDLRVIERRIERHMTANANRTNTDQQSR